MLDSYAVSSRRSSSCYHYLGLVGQTIICEPTPSSNCWKLTTRRTRRIIGTERAFLVLMRWWDLMRTQSPCQRHQQEQLFISRKSFCSCRLSRTRTLTPVSDDDVERGGGLPNLFYVRTYVRRKQLRTGSIFVGQTEQACSTCMSFGFFAVWFV